MTFTFNKRVFLTDAEGFLEDMSLWNQEIMHEMARLDGLELTDRHIIIIKTVRDYYEKFNTTPPMRSLIAYLKQQGLTDLSSSMALAALFPDGAAKSAAKYAGLKKPVKCV
ncbi:Sulfurtransferase TusE [Anaerobiospirillum thomasii]|uniref:Sulfurtransferase n=1 Tax=Anaerobiospirillum thomasii TaxID=179995 RepID=A0A2X0WPF8_9GAMM|nr:TusE/DsrC/DsvC family sulfur relay protein [Anaerobiospirillum thomasii]SPT68422.1 Sulfurtransferase TusE [Anaerobiospirillum thomasii]SPT70928.1 Sulfurtransferase TusE [Anaerobiospirillum thomasii]